MDGLRLQAFTCGWLTGDMGLFIAGESGKMKLPVPAYLIRHPKGTVVFDAGMHPELQRSNERLGRTKALFELDYHAGEEIGARLESVEVAPERVDFLVNSHLHFDHAGGNAMLPNARLVVQRAEWEATRVPELIAANGYNPDDFDHGHDLVLAEGEHDLFGDGSVVCIPTHGHTPGHQSLRVRLPGGDVVLCGDACYFKRTLEELALPAILHDREQMLASLERLRALERGGARIFYGHDAAFWAQVPQAPLDVA